MPDQPYPPGPPPVPRCPECDRIVMYHGHAPECSRGQEQAEHWGNVRAIEKALADAIAERRTDREFMRRLRERVEADRSILDRLANGWAASSTLSNVLVRMVEEHYGCPIEHIRGAEVERWAKDRCKDEDGCVITSEFEALMEALA